jgi:Ankyrin repeats (3 copies)
MERCFGGETTLTFEACATQGFYRPHSGFPDWRPSADPQEILDEALVWACKSGRTEVLPRLLRAGARLDADPYRGTPVIWAAWCNRMETAAWLIDHGATVDHKATFGGPTHGEGVTAAHCVAERASFDGAVTHRTRSGCVDQGRSASWECPRTCELLWANRRPRLPALPLGDAINAL